MLKSGQTARRTESDPYEPILQSAQVDSKSLIFLYQESLDFQKSNLYWSQIKLIYNASTHAVPYLYLDLKMPLA